MYQEIRDAGVHVQLQADLACSASGRSGCVFVCKERSRQERMI
jgi:hypothetical protein